MFIFKYIIIVEMALVSLVSKGLQDVYVSNDESDYSHFKMKYNRHTNFSQAPKHIATLDENNWNFKIPSDGDIINALWVEGHIVANVFYESTIDLYVGGQKVDSQPFEYLSDIWTNYLADTYTKSTQINNKISQSDTNFQPLHFFFCDHKAFLPLCCLAYHEVEVKVNFKATNFSAHNRTEAQKSLKVYANFVYLDTREREQLVGRQVDLLVTQVQQLRAPMETVVDNVVEEGGYNNIDISAFNHPVKSIFFGFNALLNNKETDRFTFRECDVLINGQILFEKMSPTYFHTVQNYLKSAYGNSEFNNENSNPFYTRFFAYHFGLNASEYFPNGTTNFSRLDSVKLILRGTEKGSARPSDQDLQVMAVSYNVLRLKDGMGGILFGS
jgi:hypothetical protein